MSAPHTILVVEDADECVATLEVALQAIPDSDVRSVGSAEAALGLMNGTPVSAIITDLHLPEMDGFELIRTMRQKPQWAAIPIVVVSGDSDPASPGRAISAGADAYFSKPYSPGAVRRKIEELLHSD